MIKDEFNQVEIKNEREVYKVEFGKVQKNESTSQKDNKVPESELNEKYIGKTVKKTADVNVEYTNKIQSNTATVVKSTATATTAAAATSSVVVAASTVAIAAVAVATGVTIFLHDYQCDIGAFVVSANEIYYRLSVYDNNKIESNEKDFFEEEPYDEPHGHYEENQPFVLRVYNATYDYSNYLWYGENEGSFYNLTLGDTYNIVLSENTDGGQVIYEDTFTTYENSAVKSVYVDYNVDSQTQSFGLYLDYIDELDIINDISLEMKEVVNKDEEAKTYSFPLEKTNNYQTVYVSEYLEPDTTFDFNKPYRYRIKYIRGSEERYYPEKSALDLNFYIHKQSNVFGAYINSEANFLDKSFDVTLDVIDDYEIFDNFAVTLSDAEMPEELMETFALDETIKGPQTITLTEESNIRLNRPLSYVFTYEENGEQKEITSGEITFIDTSGAQEEFLGVEFDKTANFIDKTFSVSFNYIDDLGYYTDFAFVLTDLDDSSIDPMIFNMPDRQETFTPDEDHPIDFTHQYHYSFRYYDDSVMDYQTVDGEDFYFDNNAFVFESTFDFTHDESHPDSSGSTGSDIGGSEEPLYLLPAKLIYDSRYGDLNDIDIELYNQDNENIGCFDFEEEVNDEKWHFLSYHPNGDNTFNTLFEEQSLTLEITLIDSEEERFTVCNKAVSFTKDETNEIYDFWIVEPNITAGDYIMMFRVNYSGDSANFIDPELVIETTGNTYTYSLILEGMNVIQSLPLSSPIEMNFDETTFENETANPVKISIVYNTSNGEEVSIVCYEEYSFFISH